MMTKKEFLAFASLEYDQFVSSQKDQTDAYEYERSFDEVMTRFANRFYQSSLGALPSDHRKKNDSQ